MPLDLKLRYAALYESLYWLRDKTNQESEAWSHLVEFDDQDLLTEADWAVLRQWRARAQALAVKVDPYVVPVISHGVAVRPFFGRAAELGVKAERYKYAPGSEANVQAFCKPLL